MLEMKHDFFVTDDDCMQCCKELGKQAWLFIQVLPVGTAPDDDGELSGDKNQEYMVVADRVDVSEMTRDDMEKAVCGFYQNISEMEAAYGADISQLMQLVAECRFENAYDWTGYDYASGPMKWNQAEQTIQDFIDRNESLEG